MALYEVEWTVHAGTPDERVTTQVIDAPRHPTYKTPNSPATYKWMRLVAQGLAGNERHRVDIRVSLFFPAKFTKAGRTDQLAQISCVDEFYFDFSEGPGRRTGVRS